MFYCFFLADGKAVVECDPLGTDLFMSPESLKDKCQIGLANDIWSLGVLLFFSLVSDLGTVFN